MPRRLRDRQTHPPAGCQMQRRNRRRAPVARKCLSIWEKSDPAVYPHPITNHWAKLKLQAPGLTINVPQSSAPYYKEQYSRFRYDGCLSSVSMSRISDYLTDEFTEMKPAAYLATKPRVPPEYLNPYEVLKLSSMRYWIDNDRCNNLCPIVRNQVIPN